MKVSDLKDRSRVDVIELEVVSKAEARQVTTKFGETLNVADCVVRDDTGEITLTLWNDEITRVSAGDRIKISNGWVTSFRNKLQLSAGKYGKLEILPKA
ncbi:MAG: OB-fold nucleic acid binding domain-containing protein [Thermoplasmatota archaeon]